MHYNTGRRINNGFIRNNHTVYALSDRDIIHSSKTLTDIQGIKTLNKKILDVIPIFKPDLLILGHADNVKEETLAYIKEKIKFKNWSMVFRSNFKERSGLPKK